MDCDTTGVEPDLALVKYKKLVGGGMIKIVNQTVPTALFKLGYDHDQANAIVSYIDATGTIEGAPHIKDDHLAVFDCSFKPAKGTRSIAYMGHLRMMAAAQPFISGAISKTVNLPENASVEDIMEAYLQAWKLGLKAVAVYRDGCKKSQPLSAAGTKTANSSKDDARVAAAHEEEENLNAPPRAVRHKLQEERASITHKFKVGDHEGYITVGLYPNGEPGELFITMAKEGSTVSGLMDSFALAVSHRAAARRAAETVLRKVRAHALRAQRLERQSRHRLRQVDHGLHLPLAADALPDRPAAVAVRESAAEASAVSSQPVRGRRDEWQCGGGGPQPRATSWFDPRRRRAGRHHRPGRRPHLQLLRQHHDAEWFVLSLRELREHERVQLGSKGLLFRPSASFARPGNRLLI